MGSNTSAFDAILTMVPANPTRSDVEKAMLATMQACADVAYQHANELSQKLAKPWLDTFTAQRLQNQLNGAMQAMESIQVHKKAFEAGIRKEHA